jgi:hypothetical protein
MKIKIFDENHKPLMKKMIKLKVKGKESEALSFTTNEKGELVLGDQYRGQTIAITSPNQSQWVTAAEGASITLQTEKAY